MRRWRRLHDLATRVGRVIPKSEEEAAMNQWMIKGGIIGRADGFDGRPTPPQRPSADRQ